MQEFRDTLGPPFANLTAPRAPSDAFLTTTGHTTFCGPNRELQNCTFHDISVFDTGQRVSQRLVLPQVPQQRHKM